MPQLFCALFCTPKVYTVKAQLSSNQHVESMSTGLKIFKSSYENAALGRPRGIGWRGRWEEGLEWGIHVNPWLIHVNVWEKPLHIVK